MLGLGEAAAAGPGPGEGAAAPAARGEAAGADDDGMAHVPDLVVVQCAMVSQPHWRRPLATSVARGAPPPPLLM